MSAPMDHEQTKWVDGWDAAIDFLVEYGGPENLLAAEQMRSRVPDEVRVERERVARAQFVLAATDRSGETDSVRAQVERARALADEMEAFEWQGPSSSEWTRGYARGREDAGDAWAIRLRALLADQPAAAAEGTESDG